MRRALVPVAALLASLPVLLLLEGEVRGHAFRGYALVVGLLALRSVSKWVDAASPPPPPVPFRGRQPRPDPARPPADRAEQLVRLAEHSAGDAHRGLRPALQVVADERLRARHGTTLAAGGEARLAPATWELLRPDRPRPTDGRAPGIPPERLDAVLADLEAL